MANYKSIYTGQEIDAGIAKANTAIQDVSNKVDKIEGKGLSTNDYTTEEKTKLADIDMSSKQDTLVSGKNIKTINNQSILGSGNLNIGGGSGTSDYDQLSNRPSINNNTLTGNKTLNDLGIQPVGNYLTEETDPTVPSYVKNITQSDIKNWNNKQNSISDLSTIRSGASAGATAVQPSDLATVATSGSYNDLSNKPTIPSAVTETTVTNWGFTKNTGTYSKPSGGIPKTDLASDIQDELDIVNKVTVKTRNYFNLETDIILGKNGTGASASIRAVTVAINTGGGKSTVSVKTLPSNLKYQVWGYNDDNFTSPTNYTTSWIETKGTSTVVAKAYVRVLFGTVNNANITMQDFKGLEMQVEAGSTATDYSPSSTAIDYIARNTTYPVHLKICSYNVGMYSNGISTDTPPTNATQHMSDFLSENNFDILGVQEGRTNVNGQNIDNTLYKDYFMSQMNTTNLCAIKSQFTLSDTGSGTFTQGSRPYNYGTVRIGNKNVFVINVHLGLTAEQRVSNYTELLAILAQHEYFIAFGDFNAAIDYKTGVDEQTQTEFNNLINAGYTVANGGRWGLLNTMNTTTKHPDNICVSNNIKMISAKVLNIGSTMDSDHLPVVVEIVV